MDLESLRVSLSELTKDLAESQELAGGSAEVHRNPRRRSHFDLDHDHDLDLDGEKEAKVPFGSVLLLKLMDPSMGTRNFVCVNCGSGRRTLYIQYSPGNIRLMKCESCKAVADPYIECDFMIILIDLILHKTKAYRHLLYNMLNLKAADIKGIMWKSSITYLFLDACRVFLLKKNNDWGASRSNLASLSSWAEVLLDLLMGNIVFIGLLLLGTRVLFNDTLKTIRYEEIILAVLISSYLKMYLIAMMVWEFPSSVLFIIDIFVLSSNTVTFKVLTNGKTIKCTGICFTAHAAKFFIHYMMLSL